MMVLVSLITGAIEFVIMLLVRGVVSVAAIALFARIWRRIGAWRGEFPARPFSLLIVPVWVAVAGGLLLLSFLTRLPPILPNFAAFNAPLSALWVLVAWISPWAYLIAMPVVGVVLGLLIGARVHVYATRWGRVMMRSQGRYLVLWFVTVGLAVAFRILPDGWLSTPTMGLASLTTCMVIAAHVLLYLKVKHLQLQCHQVVEGPPIDLRLDPEEAAVVSALANVWAARGGSGAIAAGQVLGELRSRERLAGDISLAVLPGVRAGWERLLQDPSRVGKIMARLAASPERGVLVQGYRPGPQLERLLRMGGMARTVTMGRVRFTPDGDGVRSTHTAVLAQAGGTNLLFAGRRDAVSLAEVDAAEMLEQMREVYRAA